MPSCSTRVQGTGAAHAAHHFVEDQQHAVPVADFAHALEVSRRWCQCAAGGTADGFRDECDDVFAADALDRSCKLLRQPLTVLLGRFAVALVAIRVSRRNMLDVDQQRRELPPAPLVAADRQRAERIAVIAVAACDKARALRLTLLNEILPRELQRSFHRFRAAGHQISVRGAAGRRRDQRVRQLLGDFGRKKARVRVRDAIDLRVHRSQHVRMAVTEARHRSAAGRVQILACPRYR